MTEPTAEETDENGKQLVPGPEGEDADGAITPGEVNPTMPKEHAHDIVDPEDIDDEHPQDHA